MTSKKKILSKNWIFNLYFNFKDEQGKGWAEGTRKESLIYMKKTMERMVSFSVIAKNKNKTCLLPTGYVHLNNAFTREHLRCYFLWNFLRRQECGTWNVLLPQESGFLWRLSFPVRRMRRLSVPP